jgi:hypothetical protein
LVLACLTCLKYAEKHHYLVIHPLWSQKKRNMDACL